MVYNSSVKTCRCYLAWHLLYLRKFSLEEFISFVYKLCWPGGSFSPHRTEIYTLSHHKGQLLLYVNVVSDPETNKTIPQFWNILGTMYPWQFSEAAFSVSPSSIFINGLWTPVIYISKKFLVTFVSTFKDSLWSPVIRVITLQQHRLKIHPGL